MTRGVRKAATLKLPAGVKWATQVPILIIPSAGHSKKGDGADGNLRRRDTGDEENTVKVRYPACCDDHKSAIKVESLATEQELTAMCTRFSQHHGHGKLYPRRAKVEWTVVEGKIPCEDCLAEYQDKQQAVA
jgi:hypothetical protein